MAKFQFTDTVRCKRCNMVLLHAQFGLHKDGSGENCRGFRDQLELVEFKPEDLVQCGKCKFSFKYKNRHKHHIKRDGTECQGRLKMLILEYVPVLTDGYQTFIDGETVVRYNDR